MNEINPESSLAQTTIWDQNKPLHKSRKQKPGCYCDISKHVDCNDPDGSSSEAVRCSAVSGREI